eukprot:9671330-Karenia_brevis.AAC.1
MNNRLSDDMSFNAAIPACSTDSCRLGTDGSGSTSAEEPTVAMHAQDGESWDMICGSDDIDRGAF